MSPFHLHRVKDWVSRADSHPALPPGRIHHRLHSQCVDSQKRIHSQSGSEREEKKSDTLKNWTERKEDKVSCNEKNVVEGKVDLQHPVFSQKMLEELRERKEETPPMETSLDNLNGMLNHIYEENWKSREPYSSY